MGAEPSSEEPRRSTPPELLVLHSPGYLSLLLVAALVGIPISLVAFGFLAGVHALEHWVWVDLPSALGFAGPPTWWAVASLGLAGVLVGLTVTRLPGHGGHVPALGTAAGPTPPSALPGVVLAAGASLVLGAVVGPEAPLIALGSGLALVAARRARADDQAAAVIAAAGSAAAISTVFGNPLVAAVLFLEVVGLARRQAMLMLLPCLVASGLGALVFTGLGEWTGLEIGALAIPDLEPATLEVGELLWALPLAAVVSLTTWAVFVVGRTTAGLARTRPLATTVAAGLVAGCSAAGYALLTSRSPAEVALSGQATLGTLAAEPELWSAGALALLLVCKSLAYAVCLGVFRGGPVFPAIFLGAAFGVLASTLLPGIGMVSGIAIGMAAGAAVTGLPVTSILLVVLLLGDAAADLMPVLVLATVTALIVDELLSSVRSRLRPDPSRPAPGAPG